MREPLLLPACALASGIAAGRAAPFSLLDGPAASLALALLALLLRRRAHPRAAAAVFALAFLPLGGWLATLRQPLPPPSSLQPGQDQLLSGCVVRPLAGPPDRRWFVLEAAPGALLRVTLSGGDRHPASSLIHYGRRLSFTARVREPRNFQNPGSFDYSAYLAARGIHWQATLPARSPAQSLPGRCGSAPAAFIFHLRQNSLARLDQLFPHQPFHRSPAQSLPGRCGSAPAAF
ncbi:MAG TPA: ComEC/Rec2 family competence protein, partial [Bryobacteraceae bacterium]|nr:ComEC/Rec2 family competence protein [Bryobacteraceae bacterium]